MNRRLLLQAGSLLLVAALLVACSGLGTAATPVSIVSTAGAASPTLEPTATPTAEPTPTATVTPSPPTATIQPTRRPPPATTKPTSTARPTATRTPKPSPVDTRNPLLFMDEFDDNRNAWSLKYGRLEGGELHIHTTEEGRSWMSICTKAGEFSTFSYEVQARKVEGNDGAGYGLIFRASRDGKQLYAFVICGGGYYALSKWDGDKWINVVNWKESPTIRRGNQKNKLVVSCYENFYDILVNDQVVISHAVDDFRANGLLGLMVSYGAHVAYDSVRVWRR